MTTPTLFLSLHFTDCARAARLLEAMGFERRAWRTDPADDTVVTHAQYAWGEAGGIMFGSAGRAGRDAAHSDHVGTGLAYLVVATDDDVDRVHAAAQAAGATEVQPPTEMNYGGRGSTIADFDGNEWSLGSFAGA